MTADDTARRGEIEPGVDVSSKDSVISFGARDTLKVGDPNALAVEVFAPTENDLAITFVDWNPAPPDKNMGLWRAVYVEASGPSRDFAGFLAVAHAPWEARRVLVLKACRVDDAKLEPEQLRVPFTAVARYARPVIDQRQALADEPVEQRRFPDVGPADDRDSGQGHGAGD